MSKNESSKSISSESSKTVSSQSNDSYKSSPKITAKGMRKSLVRVGRDIKKATTPLSNIVSHASHSVSASIHTPNKKYKGRE